MPAIKSPQPVSIFKKSAVSRFFEPINPAIATASGSPIPEAPEESFYSLSKVSKVKKEV
jgi:hypothetical protein